MADPFAIAMTEEIAKLLREPFPPEKVGKLPKVTCGNCRDARSRVCEQHVKNRCGDCQSFITSAHIHLDFVGHADATDRLLEADPEWNWEPFALDPRGLPAIDENGGMWIRLTVAGVTRIGYGDADGKRGGAAVKETIGDAIRNASMRFGVALDLWRKEPHVDESSAPRRRRPRDSAPVDADATGDGAEGWEQAEHAPAPAQVAAFDALRKEIARATAAQISGVAQKAKAAVQAGDITRFQNETLAKLAAARLAELSGPAVPEGGETR